MEYVFYLSGSQQNLLEDFWVLSPKRESGCPNPGLTWAPFLRLLGGMEAVKPQEPVIVSPVHLYSR